MYANIPVPLTFVSASVAEDDAPIWASGTTYNFGNPVIRNGFVYLSSINGNVGIDPATEPQELEGARWILKGPTNMRAFLDDVISTPTVGTGTLVLEVEAGEYFNSVALLGLNGNAVTVELIRDGAVQETREIRAGAEPVTGWLGWVRTIFFKRVRRHVLRDFAGFAGAHVRITIEGAAPSLGMLAVGRALRIGTTLMNDRTRIAKRTFSEIKTDVFGKSKAVKRATTRDITYSVKASRRTFWANERALDELDGVKVVTWAHDDYPELIGFGFLSLPEVPVELPETYFFELTNEGVE